MAISFDDLLNWGKQTLKNAGIDDFAISAEMLLRSLLSFSRSELILNLHQTISSQNENEYRELISRRSRHIPLQHLTGLVEFYNVEIKCDNRALIPRPETEILVEKVLERLKNISNPKILDIGIGSGNISIALAKNLPGSHITGVDISQDALDLVASNAQLNHVEYQIAYTRGDILDSKFIQTLGLFDCIVSNPPYVPLSEKDKLQPEVTRYEPAIAIFLDGDPLIFYKTITMNISYILRPKGILAFEAGLGQAQAVENFMKLAFDDIIISKDLAGLERIITGIYAGAH
jgi:release factor glutamine methyltransferase